MSMVRIKSLQKKLILFVLLPVAAFMAGVGVAGYFYIRGSLLREWQEAATLRLERAAHQMDMMLSGPLHWMQALGQTGGGRQGEGNRQWILKQLEEHPGVSRVTMTWRDQAALTQPVARVSAPQYFYPEARQTVGLRSELLDDAGRPLGRLEVLVKFGYLMQDLLSSGWMVLGGIWLSLRARSVPPNHFIERLETVFGRLAHRKRLARPCP